MEKTWVAYTDGSAVPGGLAAGWGAVVLKEGTPQMELQGWERGRDSAWAELMAMWVALAAVPAGARVLIYTDHFPAVEVFGGRGSFHRPDLHELWRSLVGEAERRGLRLELRWRRRMRSRWSRTAHQLANGARERALGLMGEVAKAA